MIVCGVHIFLFQIGRRSFVRTFHESAECAPIDLVKVLLDKPVETTAVDLVKVLLDEPVKAAAIDLVEVSFLASERHTTVKEKKKKNTKSILYQFANALFVYDGYKL